MAMPAKTAKANDENPARSAAPECGHDQQGDGHRVDRAVDARDQHAESGHDQRRRDVVGAGQDGGREAQDHSGVPVLGRGAGGQAEAGEPVDGPEDRGHRDNDRREHDLVLGDRDPAGELEGRLRQDRLHRAGTGAEAQDDDRLEHDHQPDRGDDLRQRRRRQQRSDDEEVDEQRQDHHDDEGHGERRAGGHRRSEVDPGRPLGEIAGYQGQGVREGWQEQRPVPPEPVEDVGREHRHRAGREVDHPRAPVGEDHREGDGPHQGPGAEAEESRLDHQAAASGAVSMACPLSALAIEVHAPSAYCCTPIWCPQSEA